MHEPATASKSGARALDSARTKFLSREGETDPQVRRMIMASWQRSRDNDVGIDRIRVPYVRDPDLEAPLFRSAAPILDTLGDQLQSESVSIILTDHTGMVLDRRCSGADINTRLDQVHLAPGFSYAEEFAGTNGIGTSLTSGRAAFVEGHEHYSEELRQFACAGSPIRHPTRGKVIGLLDLTSWSHSPGAMLMALASATARQIEQELLAQTGMRELALFSEYLKVCQQSNGPVLALNNDVVMTNNDLRQLLDGPEHEALVGYAIDTMQSAKRESMRTVQLPSGRNAYLRYTPANCADGPAGGVFRIRFGRLVEPVNTTAQPAGRATGPLTMPGLVGSGTVWSRCVQQVDSRYRAGDWMALEGELGTGKQSLLRAVHRLHNPSGNFRILQAPEPADFEDWLATLAEALTVPEAMIVLAEAEQLTDQQASAVGDLLIEASADPERHSRVAITVSTSVPKMLRAVFPRTVDVPA
ncbi:MAG: GAF domain-containing protein, partial [Jatrophihabitantaceae bacterium]